MVKTTLAAGMMALFLTTGCEGNNPRDTWIDTHPTHAGPNGECIEADGEPCDDDPYDLDDLFESDGKPKLPTVKPASKRPSPKPMQTAFQPKPRTTRR